MKIYTSYFGNYKNIDSDIQCLSIANSKPQGLALIKWKEVVPNWSYVTSFKNKQISFELFKQMYLNYLMNLKYSHDFKFYLEHFNSDVCLLCWEKDVNECHRKVLAEFLQQFYGIEYMGEVNE